MTEEGTAPQSGAEVLEWCRTLRDADMLDQCLDHAVSRTPPAPDETCSAIRTPRIRESCALAVADRRRPGHQTLGPMLEDCAPTGATLPFCLTHVIEDRTAWWSHQPVDTVVAEIGAMVARFPEAGTSETVALSMFVAMSRPGFPDATRRRACTALPAPTDAYCLAPPMSRGLCPEPGSSPQRLVACDDLPGGAHRQGPPVQAPSAPGP